MNTPVEVGRLAPRRRSMPENDVTLPSFPRLAQAHWPEVQSNDEDENARQIRHDVKERLSPLKLVSYALRTNRDQLTPDDWGELLRTLDAAIADIDQIVTLVRRLPPQPPPPHPRRAS